MKRGLSILVAFALLVTSFTVSDNSAEAAKKATLATKSIVVTTQKTGAIVIKNKNAKYSYSFVSKNKKIASVTSKGVVKGVKIGTTLIVVKEKYKKGKKTVVRTLGNVKVTVGAVAVVTAKPTIKPVVTPVPTATPDPSIAPLDLSKTYMGTGTYDSKTKYLQVKDTKQFQVDLPRTLYVGDKLTVTVKGTYNIGKVGFSVYLSNDEAEVGSKYYKSASISDVAKGEFNVSFDVVATAKSTRLTIGGPTLASKIDDITFKSVTAHFLSAPRQIPDPYVPKTEQSPDLANLILSKCYNMSFAGIEEVQSLIENQRFIADPTCIEYNGRLYVYGTTDEIEFDEKDSPISNAYNTHTLSCISTSDLVNWRDEGKIDVKKITTWATKSWAPTIASKEVNGKLKFFLYYTNGGSGIGVLSSDSPTGPWVDPVGATLINSNTPTCENQNVPWIFDPGVLVDSDGTGYIYFGGGTSTATGSKAHPKSGRVAKLGADMISLASTPKELDTYYFFEDNEINKFGDTYYYSYCTNWSVPADDKDTAPAAIAYYTADNPMLDNWTYHGTVLANPGTTYNHSYNNHHHMFQWKGENYILYHTTALEQILYGTKMGYRSLHLGKLTMNSDKTLKAEGTATGVEPTSALNPFETNSATTMCWDAGLTTTLSTSQNAMVLDKINTGDWLGVRNVDFGTTGAKKVEMSLASTTAAGSIDIYLDSTTSAKVGTVSLTNTSDVDTYKLVTANLTKTVTGKHNVYFVFRGKDYHVLNWKFIN